MTPPPPLTIEARRNSLNQQGRSLEEERRVGDPSFRVGDPSFRVGGSLLQRGGSLLQIGGSLLQSGGSLLPGMVNTHLFLCSANEQPRVCANMSNSSAPVGGRQRDCYAGLLPKGGDITPPGVRGISRNMPFENLPLPVF